MGMGMGPGPMVKVGGFQVTMNSNGSTTVVPLTPQMLPPPEVMKRIMQVLLDAVMYATSVRPLIELITGATATNAAAT